MTDPRLVVNGRFLAGSPTGLHRVARNVIAQLALENVPLEIVVPPHTDDPVADRTVWGPPGRLGALLWEQLILPARAGGRPIVSLVNTGPVGVRRAAVMVHDLTTFVGPEWFRADMRFYGRVSMAAARRARVVMTVSMQVRDELIAAGIAGDRVHAVRMAVDPSFVPSTAADVDAVRASYGLSRPYVIHVGYADPRKNAITLVEAHIIARERVPHDLVLVGTPHPNFAPAPLPDVATVHRLGRVSDADLRALLTGAACLAYPSLYEGFGHPPLEAMACGTPAVVSDIPAHREATEGAATYLPALDVAAWADALERAARGELPPPRPPLWTWADTGRQLVAALASLRN